MRNRLIVVAAAALVAMVSSAGPSQESAPSGTPAQIAQARAQVAEAEAGYQRAKAATESARRTVQAAELEELAARGRVSGAQIALFLLEETPAQRKVREDRQRWEREHNPPPSSSTTKPG